MKPKSVIRFVWFAFCALMLIACSSGGSSNPTGQVSFQLSDSPATDYEAVYVTIEEIQVHTVATDAGEEDGEWLVISTPQKTLNLLDLINGTTADLGIGSLDAGDYTQIRLVIGEVPYGDHLFANYIVMKGGEQTYELKIPSGEQSGIKLVHGFSVVSAGITEILMDFDVSSSIVMAGISGNWLLKPVIKVLTIAESGTISGSVTDNSDSAGEEEVLVSIQKKSPAEGEDQVVAATVTDESGGYQVSVAPGDYVVVITKDGFVSQVADVTVVAGETTNLDFTVETTEEDGTVEGDVTVDGGTDESHVTLVFKQMFGNDNAQILVQIASLNIGEGGGYSIKLPTGFYYVVAIAENGEEQDKGTIEITANININISISFTIIIDDTDDDDDTDGEKVQVCHNGNTITISAEDLQDHLDHGDTEGPCEDVSDDDDSDADGGDDADDDSDDDDCTGKKVIVCHNGNTIEIACSALDAHLAQGDTIGACGEDGDDGSSDDGDSSSDDSSSDSSDSSSDDSSSDSSDSSSDDSSSDSSDSSSDDSSSDNGDSTSDDNG